MNSYFILKTPQPFLESNDSSEVAATQFRDFNDVRHDNLPQTLHENGRTVVMVDARRYRDMNEDQKRTYREAVSREIKKSDMSETQKSDALDRFNDVFKKLDKNESVETRNYFEGYDDHYQRITHHFRIVVVDDIPPHLSIMSLIKPDRRPVQSSKIESEFVTRHEYAHAAYGLKEPGAEYVAAVETLIAHPEARAQIQQMSDNRMVRSVLHGDSSGAYHILYGEETARAGRDALHLSENELNRLRAMTPEKRRQELLNHAHELDEHLYDTDVHHSDVAQHVKDDLQGLCTFDVTEALKDPAKFHKLSFAVHGLLANHRYPPGSPEGEMLQKLGDAIDRTEKINGATSQKDLHALVSFSNHFSA